MAGFVRGGEIVSKYVGHVLPMVFQMSESV